MQAVKFRGRQFIQGIGIVDETSCGPLCQHPSCWRSSERLEKGFPNLVEESRPAVKSADDLPSVTVYNMLEDYGESTKDRYQPHHQCRLSQEKFKSRSSRVKPLHSGSLPPTDCPANTPNQSVVGPMRSVQFQKKSTPNVKKVEVQEVFDLDDLNNTWDDTFLAKQYYVWVPNPNRKRRKKAIDLSDNITIEKLGSGPVTILPRDMTEELVPQSIEIEREATKMKKSGHTRSYSPSRFFSNTPRGQTRNDVDLEGINELLDLPRDILMKVLDHCQPSDLSSRERIIEIVQRFLPNVEKDPNRAPLSQQTDVLQLSKVELLDGKKRNIRQPELMGGGQPVFRLDDENLIYGVTAASTTPFPEDERALCDVQSPRQAQSLKDFSPYKRPLPAIGTGQISSARIKIPSVSLGLPAIPSGVRTTRPFNYQKQDIDFSLGPVPTPPASEVISLIDLSEHGTTVRVNVPSDRSEKLEVQTIPDCTCQSRQSYAERISTSFEDSFVYPNAPLGTPQSPAFYRNALRSSGLKREITSNSIMDERIDMLTTPVDGHYSQRNTPIRVPTDIPSGDHPALMRGVPDRRTPSTCRDEDGGHTEASTRFSVQFAMEIPPQPPSSPQNIPADNFSLSPTPTHIITGTLGVKEIGVVTPQATFNTNPISRGETLDRMNGATPITDRTTPASTPDVWPTDVVEKSFDISRTVTRQSVLPMTPESLDSQAVGFDARSEKSRLTSVQLSEVSSPISEPRYSRMKMEDTKCSESPGPPPPSPEPRDTAKKHTSDEEPTLRSRFSSKSRDSLSMAPVLEEGEDSGDDMSISANPPETLFLDDSQKFVSDIRGIAPDRNSNNGKPGPSVDTFVNVDIAGDVEGSPDVVVANPVMLTESEVVYPRGPPEFDGMSSTYMTERDRRFSPEGGEEEDHPLGHSGHFRDSVSPPALESEGHRVDGPEILQSPEPPEDHAVPDISTDMYKEEDVDLREGEALEDRAIDLEAGTRQTETPDRVVNETFSVGDDSDIDVYLGHHSDADDVEAGEEVTESRGAPVGEPPSLPAEELSGTFDSETGENADGEAER